MNKITQKSLEIAIFFGIPILYSIWHLYHFHSFIIFVPLDSYSMAGFMFVSSTIGSLLWTTSFFLYKCYKDELSKAEENDKTNNSNNNNIDLVEIEKH